MSKISRQAISEQSPVIRIQNFKEVQLGYSEGEALLEASRCLNCKVPKCVAGCPVNVQIPAFIQQILAKDYYAACRIIKTTNAFPSVCGRVCPQEVQCEGNCILGIKSEPVAIGRLERFVGDYARVNAGDAATVSESVLSHGRKVAVIGAGPAGLTCAADLAKAGFEVDLFEAFHAPGGVMMYGIPEFRLPKSIVHEEVQSILDLGVQLHLNYIIGKLMSIDELKAQGYSAVFIGVGAGLPSFMNIPGEDLSGVYSANEFLTRINLMKAYQFPDVDTPVRIGKRVAVVGGGNVAMDAARAAKRLNADVTLIYRRSEAEMPARLEEVHHAKEEGIQLMPLTHPIEILANDQRAVAGLRCIKMMLGEPDQSGRRSPVSVDHSEFELAFDSIIIAIGNTANPLLTRNTDGLKLNSRGNIVVVDEFGLTSLATVYAGGDIVTGAATVIEAMGAGKKAAAAIIQSFQS